MVKTKICVDCKNNFQLLPDFWYLNPNTKDGFQAYCKKCAKERSKQQSLNKSLGIHKRRLGETLANEYLLKAGIYSDYGSVYKRYKWIDIVAWGCIKIEVKLSTNIIENKRNNSDSLKNANGYWYFSFRSTINKNTILPDLIMLILNRGDNHYTYHILPANHPIFFSSDDSRKAGIDYIEYENWMFSSNDPMKQNPILLYQDRIELIEEIREKISTDLIISAHEKK